MPRRELEGQRASLRWRNRALAFTVFTSVVLAIDVFILSYRDHAAQLRKVRLSIKPLPFPTPILYFVKTCAALAGRDELLYDAWASRESPQSDIIYATDVFFDANIPRELQRAYKLPDDKLTADFLASAAKGETNRAKSCATSLMVLGSVLQEAKWRQHSWLMVVDDDTFVNDKRVHNHLAQWNPVKESLYVGFAFGERTREKENGTEIELMTASSSAGFALSRYLLDWMRNDTSAVFERSSVYKQCKDARMMDDLAMGRLVSLYYNIPLRERPGVRADWHNIPKDKYHSQQTIHLQMRGAGSNSSKQILKKLKEGLE